LRGADSQDHPQRRTVPGAAGGEALLIVALPCGLVGACLQAAPGYRGQPIRQPAEERHDALSRTLAASRLAPPGTGRANLIAARAAPLVGRGELAAPGTGLRTSRARGVGVLEMDVVVSGRDEYRRSHQPDFRS